jgi:hypothetical protein
MLLPGRLIASISLCVLLISPFSSYEQDMKPSSILNYFHFNGEPNPSHEQHVLLEHQARWDDAVSGDLNPTGSRLNPEGLHLRFTKIDEQTTPGGQSTAHYRVYAEGAPENKVYSFGTWPMASNLVYDPQDLYVNGQGLLMLHKPKPEQEFSFKAEADEYDVVAVTDSAVPTRFVLASRDRQLMVFGTLVPNPVMAEEQGCRLEARLAQPDATAVLIIADRFPAKDKIPLVLESEGMSSNQLLMTNAEGHAVMGVFPYVAGHAHGLLKASAEGPNCVPYVVLPWGAGPQAGPKTQQAESPKNPGQAAPGAPDSKPEHPKKSFLKKLHL